MPDDFRREAKENLGRLLTYWHTIEVWLKKSEQISSSAVIPAINELRYASRQLYNAVTLAGQYRLDPGERSSLSRRMILAEQYLLNADHDIGDAITSFYKAEIQTAEKELGAVSLRQYFAKYPDFKALVEECEGLILGARADYDSRAANYKRIRTIHVDQLRALYPMFIEAYAQGRFDREKLQTELARAQTKVTLLTWFGVFASAVTIASVFVSVFLWLYPATAFCNDHRNDMLAKFCEATVASSLGADEAPPPRP